MNQANLGKKQILSRLAADEFIAESFQFDEILRHAKNEHKNNGMLILASPFAGTTELLFQVYDQLFYQNDTIIPFYFAFSKNDKDAESTALRFLQTFLLQTVAFRRNDAELLKSSPDICEIAELALPTDGIWIDRLVNNCETKSKLNDVRSFIRHCLSSPFRAASKKVSSFIILDNLHEADEQIIIELQEIFSRSTLPFVFAGKRRFVLNAFQNSLENVEILKLNGYSDSDANLLIESLSQKNDIKITRQTADLINRQFAAKSIFIRAIFDAASKKKTDLDNFQKVQQVFTDELLGGKIARIYDSIFDKIIPNAEVQRQLLRLLHDSISAKKSKIPIQTWKKRISLNETEFYRLIKELHIHEIIQLKSSIIEFNLDEPILKNYLTTRFRIEILGEPRALVVADCLSESLKNSPNIMSNYYRRGNALGLRELLSVFACQEISSTYFDYSNFKKTLKGLEDNEILQNLADAKDKIKLPQMVYSANCVAFYPQITQFSEAERSVVSLGFDSADYNDENEIVWIVAEFDSKLEASKDLTEFWCDRLEMVAVMCNFSRYQIWLISPEGFSDAACKILQERKVFSSSRKQIEFLAKKLNAENIFTEKPNQNEYEMILPMGEDTELIAAHTVEEIARRYSFTPKAINQMKTALVEACINATEHSNSPDRKIYQKFTVEEDKIIITISNRGIKIPKSHKQISEIIPTEGRRGWGLKLIKNLMDEVKFEQVEEGTKISMTKYLVKN